MVEEGLVVVDDEERRLFLRVGGLPVEPLFIRSEVPIVPVPVVPVPVVVPLFMVPVPVE